jgi:hypothetical protein
LDKKYYEINLDSRRETTMEEDRNLGVYSGVIGALIADCYPLLRDKAFKAVIQKQNKSNK